MTDGSSKKSSQKAGSSSHSGDSRGLDPLDIAQANRRQGLFMGVEAQIVVVKTERAPILEDRIRNRCARSELFADALDESRTFSSLRTVSGA